ncbi:MAG: class I SAM-dependent methyltransferase [Candidatus Cloacimonetes bacterium]|nr:class I SAM-dependent methyltransferase [Candidatus Cloacimonadota bacterium]
MAIPILDNWEQYFSNSDEGLGSSYERIIINKKLDQICKHFNVSTILEAPSFGFTGLSGINSMGLAQRGKKITLLDNDKKRIKLIKNVWADLQIPLNIAYSENYSKLSYKSDQFELSWNFSALWLVKDLSNFLKELSRVTSRVILFFVPNKRGLGYLSQKILGYKVLKERLMEQNIKPGNIKREMSKNGWLLLDTNYIDCPPWPDIGMPKEKFLKMFMLNWLSSNKEKRPISILDHYKGNDPEFSYHMLSYFWFENKAPKLLKTFWAHHRYFLFIPENRK